MTDISHVKSTLQEARNYIRSGLADFQAAAKLAPDLITQEKWESVIVAANLLLQMDEACEDLDDVAQQLTAARAEMKRQIRIQKQWRIMACRVCLGGAKTQDLLNRAFRDLITEPATDEQLDAELHELVERLELKEQAAADFGPLREIDI